MADTKISNLTELAAAPDAADELLVVDKSDTAMAASGTDKRLRYDRISPFLQPWSRPETDPFFPSSPSGGLVANLPRELASDNTQAISSGVLYLYAFRVWPGLVIAKASFWSGTTAAGTPLNQWSALVNPDDLDLIRVSNDDTTTAWAANTRKEFTFTSSYTVPSGMTRLYVGIMVRATTVISSLGRSLGSNVISNSISPRLATFSTTGLTTPGSCPDPVGALGTGFGIPYIVLH